MELVLVEDKINKILAVAVLAGIIICNICSVWCTVCWCVATRNLVALHVCMAAQQQNSSHMSLFSPKGCNLKLCMSTSCPTIPPSESFTPKIPHFVSPCHWTSFPNQKPPPTHTHTLTPYTSATMGRVRKPPKKPSELTPINSGPLHWTWSLCLDLNVEEYKRWAALPWQLGLPVPMAKHLRDGNPPNAEKIGW